MLDLLAGEGPGRTLGYLYVSKMAISSVTGLSILISPKWRVTYAVTANLKLYPLKGSNISDQSELRKFRNYLTGRLGLIFGPEAEQLFLLTIGPSSLHPPQSPTIDVLQLYKSINQEISIFKRVICELCTPAIIFGDPDERLQHLMPSHLCTLSAQDQIPPSYVPAT